MGVAEDIRELVAGKLVAGKKPGTEKIEKGDARGKNGGARAGSGRKPIAKDPDSSEMRRSFMQLVRAHANELVPVKITDNVTGKVKIVKRKRIEVAVEVLFSQVQTKEGWAVREYLDRVLGKAAQPIVGDEDEPIVLRVDF